jgi:hypothetical protein
MKKRPLTRSFVLSVSLILPSVLVLTNFSASRPRLGSTLRADGAPMPPPEPLPPPPPPRLTGDSPQNA